jgi:hypothetical protein
MARRNGKWDCLWICLRYRQWWSKWSPHLSLTFFCLVHFESRVSFQETDLEDFVARMASVSNAARESQQGEGQSILPNECCRPASSHVPQGVSHHQAVSFHLGEERLSSWRLEILIRTSIILSILHMSMPGQRNAKALNLIPSLERLATCLITHLRRMFRGNQARHIYILEAA